MKWVGYNGIVAHGSNNQMKNNLMTNLNNYIGKICQCKQQILYTWSDCNDPIKRIPSNTWFVITKIEELTGVEKGTLDVYLLTKEGELRFTTLDEDDFDQIQIVTHE